MSSSGIPGNAQPQGDGLPPPRRYWAMVAIALAIVMSVLDSTIVNIALPTLARNFGVSRAASIWVVNAYQLAILTMLLPLAALGERIGYRRISQTGLAVFTLASLGCALAPTLLTLCLARAIQGLGAAGIMSVSPALVRFTYPHRQLGRAIGITAFVVASSAALGPTVAAAVLSVAQWRWLFGINIPIGIAALGIAICALPDNGRTRRPVNIPGIVLNAGTFGLLVSGLQSFAHHAATALALVQIVGGAFLAILLVRHELGRDAPMIPFDLLRSRLFSLSLVTSVCSFMAQAAALVALPFEIQRLGHGAAATGLMMTPWPLALAVAAPLAGRLADHYPAGILGGLGLLALTAGLGLLAFLPAGASTTEFVWRMALCGFGFGLFQAPNNRAIMSSAPRERSGAAGGMLSAARLLGQSLGAAGVAILFRSYAASGSHVALCVAAALAFGGALVSTSRVTGGPPRRSS